MYRENNTAREYHESLKVTLKIWLTAILLLVIGAPIVANANPISQAKDKTAREYLEIRQRTLPSIDGQHINNSGEWVED